MDGRNTIRGKANAYAAAVIGVKFVSVRVDSDDFVLSVKPGNIYAVRSYACRYVGVIANFNNVTTSC